MCSDFAERVENISDDPFERAPKNMKEIIKNPEIKFDVHCHFFNEKCIPKNFFRIRIPRTAKFLSWLEHTLHKLCWWSDTDQLSKYAYFLSICKSEDIGAIATKLFGYHLPQETTIFCPLMMDFEPGLHEEPETKYYDQIDNMKKLKKEFPLTLLPFIAIDPNRDYVKDKKNKDEYGYREIFLEAFSKENSFFGIKIYPSLGYLPSDPRLMEIYEICQEKNTGRMFQLSL